MRRLVLLALAVTGLYADSTLTLEQKEEFLRKAEVKGGWGTCWVSAT